MGAGEGGGRRAGWSKGERGHRWIDHVRGLSGQSAMRSVQTRSMENRLETSVVTRIGANTTPINNKKNVSKQRIRMFDISDAQQ